MKSVKMVGLIKCKWLNVEPVSRPPRKQARPAFDLGDKMVNLTAKSVA
jgi:hypothetical protein